MHLEHVALVVDDYDAAIAFFVDTLGFALVEDFPSLTNDGRPKRWVVVRPPGERTGLLLARADGPEQEQAVGAQFAGRVGLFLRVADFDAAFARMQARGVRFVTEPRDEPYGRVAVFLDVAGNRWDLLGPRPVEPSEVLRLVRQTSWGADRTEDDLARALRAAPVHAGIWSGDRLIGFARAVTDGVYRAFVEDVVVDGAHRGQGVGRRVVEQLLQRLGGVEVVALDCGEDIVPFYEGLGFTRDGNARMVRGPIAG